MHLEQKLKKEQIFEYYANQVPLGHRGSFGIRGFGEAAQVYFGKDVTQLTLPEAATLAGLIQQPSFTNPYRWPERAKQRRNVVLKLMRENKYISDEEYRTRDGVADGAGASKAWSRPRRPIFVDLVNDTLLEKFPDYNFQSNTYRVYTTLDLNLQRDAAEAVRIGMEEADQRIKGRKKKDPNYPDPQCALIALDPQTGEVRALVGGRNYGASQLNRILAKRQPGSSFKPFVYAAALNTGLSTGGNLVLTPATMIDGRADHVLVRRQAVRAEQFRAQILWQRCRCATRMAHSLNVATVKVAEADRLRRGGGSGAAGGIEHGHPAHAGGGAGRLRSDAARDRRRLHDFRQPRHLLEAVLFSDIASDHGSNIFDSKPEHRDGAGSARGVSDGPASGRSGAERNGSGHVRARHQFSGGGKDRHVARWLVRRIYVEVDLRGVGGIRRQSAS